MRVVFFGTPVFAAKTLHFLIQKGVNVVAVVSKPDRPKGRSGNLLPTPVKEVTLQEIPEIPLYQPEKASTPEFVATLTALKPDFFVVVAYGEIINQALLELPRIACINVHASLLPKYRGAAPIQWALINGERETGITIMHMTRKLDAGDMIKQATIPIHPETNAGELQDKLQQVGEKLLWDVLEEMKRGVVHRIKQEENLVSFAPKLELVDGQVDWKRDAKSLHNLVRGVTPEPGAWSPILVRGEKKRLKILKSGYVQGYSKGAGQIMTYGKEGIIVGCGEEALRLVTVQLEGKGAVSGEAFAAGYPQEVITFKESVAG